MKQLALAFHQYEHSRGHFPRGWVLSDHRAGLGSRSYVAAILPYVEQYNLSVAYRFDREWDARENARVVGTVLPILLCPSAPARPGLPIGDYPVSDFIASNAAAGLGLPGFPDYRNQGFFDGVNGWQTSIEPKYKDIADGLSNTWLLFEDSGRPQYWRRGRYIGENVTEGRFVSIHHFWAEPMNRITIQVYPPVNTNNGNEIYSFHPGGCNFAYGDGSVRFISQTISDKAFVAAYTRAGGETD